ncbi:ABC-F family ATP-binding cassette domain-containing protein [Paenibacillus sp. CAU 1782]
MTMISFQQIIKIYGDHIVLNQASFELPKGKKAALAGANGSGKSTILKLVMGLEEADHGDIALASDITIGYLPQTLSVERPVTIAQYIADSQHELVELQRNLEELSARLATAEGRELDAAMAAYGTAESRFQQCGGYDLDYRTRLVMEGLGLGQLDEERRLATLSGGQQTRVGLAALLIETPDLLLLDEPTNHLDEGALSWLESYLSAYPGTVLMSSHDRHFMNRCANVIIEVDDYTSTCRTYPGDYDHYKQCKAKELIRWEESYRQQEEEMERLQERMSKSGRQVGHNRPARDKDKFIPHYFKGRVQNAISRNVRNAEVKLEQLLARKIEKPPQPLSFQLDFRPEEQEVGVALSVIGACKGYPGQRELLQEVELTVKAGTRILITGPNGSGKTTLLDLLGGAAKPDSGSVFIGEGINIGYLEQGAEAAFLQGTNEIDARSLSLMDAYRLDRIGYEEDFRSELLATRLFHPRELEKKLTQLSPGQLRKLQLARLIVSRANLLLLDEPTNHLSPDLMEQLEEALSAFPGTVIAVSHDRKFRSALRGEVYQLKHGKLERAKNFCDNR